jgi:hypothetical protein
VAAGAGADKENTAPSTSAAVKVGAGPRRHGYGVRSCGMKKQTSRVARQSRRHPLRSDTRSGTPPLQPGLHWPRSCGKADKNPRASVALCARAAWLGDVPALRELGHCLQDGYGVRRDAGAGRHLLLHAVERELFTVSSARCRRGWRGWWWPQRGAKLSDLQIALANLFRPRTWACSRAGNPASPTSWTT